MNGIRFALILVLCLCPRHSLQADGDQFFREAVEPILKQHCYDCHSHTAGVMEGDLTLDWQSGWKKGGSRGPAIVPGQPEQSLLIKAVQHTDPNLKMPDEKLSDQQIAILTKWVQQGASDPRIQKPQADTKAALDWWSLKPLNRPTVPGAGNTNPIDAFIQDRLRQQGLKPAPPADRRTLIRRLMYDLQGMHPTPAEVEAFVNDKRPDAYAQLVDQLLASPRYGERWARHWLDTIHFADSHGFEHDVFRPHAWRFRDYVIERFNQDIPWARFIREQLAADSFYPDASELTVALGFLGAGPYDQSAAATAPKSFEYLDRDDLVTQTMGAFVSTTANCARCHTHKFDPITQSDYFSLQAVFAGVGKGDVSYDAEPAVAQQRKKWESLHQAALANNATVLLKPEYDRLVTEWEQQRGPEPKWHVLQPKTFVSNGGAELKRQPDQSILASGPAPEQESILVTTQPEQNTITAVRLDLLTDPSLPHQGPGRAHNGNLHLNEVEIRLFPPEATEGQKLTIKRATADFNQEGWTIQHALDGNPKTAWGIYPKVGVSHYAVFELQSPLNLEPGTRLVVSLKQVHGGAHLIGRFKLSVTDAAQLDVIALPAEAEAILKIPADQRTPAQQTTLAAVILKNRAEQELAQLPAQAKVYAAAAEAANERGMVKFAQPREIHLLARGNLEKPRGVVGPGALSALPSLPARFDQPKQQPEAARRAALADWLADPQNPLTWRSIANRVWHYHFGKGLCDTPNDFGRMGGTPSHPELLDWLACELRDHNGSLKHLHRLICNSQTYQQSSAFRSELSKIDPENRLLARWSRQRLDADSYRDAVLRVNGTLDLTMGGPGVQQFTQSPGPQATPVLHYDQFDLDSPGAYRRSIYRVVWRGIPDPLMDALDFPDLGLLAPVRGFSASPLQSLVLWNNRFVLHHAQKLAERTRKAQPMISDQVRQIVLWAWLREPAEDEQRQLTQLAEQHGLETVARLVMNSNEFLFVE
ncbi:PSD1 and planctomycete cytochrome C domain-containing protein [Gimesia panareensis]|uniref:PSD1 and planctomycete cytochrome C domain-containing protein n=1 Tax=Gimesia panareensis TaxID=2527978 RepID=UPI001189F96B|nr:PSD1 and planctomycete cytochrome C domain-containing protein [Gimesia panareensis]QDU50910.1 Planctomycete cytochrome C [Gimesia panareensis]